jgi:hypothetical protein
LLTLFSIDLLGHGHGPVNIPRLQESMGTDGNAELSFEKIRFLEFKSAPFTFLLITSIKIVEESGISKKTNILGGFSPFDSKTVEGFRVPFHPLLSA